MLKIKHVPEQLIDVTLTPVLFVLLFTYMYGGAISGSTGEYLQFILPGTSYVGAVHAPSTPGSTLNTDITKGVVDRFRSLPIWSPGAAGRRRDRRRRPLRDRRPPCASSSG